MITGATCKQVLEAFGKWHAEKHGVLLSLEQHSEILEKLGTCKDCEWQSCRCFPDSDEIMRCKSFTRRCDD